MLIIDTATDEISMIDLRHEVKSFYGKDYDEDGRSVTSSFKWGGAAMAPNGAIYMAPWNADGFMCVAPRPLLDTAAPESRPVLTQHHARELLLPRSKSQLDREMLRQVARRLRATKSAQEAE